MYMYLSVHSPHYSTFIILQLVKVPAYAHLFYFGARSLIIISSSRGKLQPSTLSHRTPRPYLSIVPPDSRFAPRVLKLIMPQIINMNSTMMARVILMDQLSALPKHFSRH